jgi:hypothetical protein
VALFALAVVADVHAATYYVNPSGNDANTGTSTATPFCTIKKAAEVIQSGDTVYVAAGTYTDEIVVNGVQGSSLPATFIGNSGATVSTRWIVVNSNYVQIEGFTFQDTASRFLVWRGSYEGRIENCQFNAGDEGLLVKSGSLTIDNCLIQDFTQDGIQVDGEADVLVTNSTISGCQEAGVEIRKAARVEFENCTVSGQVGDGIEVNVVTDVINSGLAGILPAPLVGSNGPVSFSNGSFVHGNFFHSAGSNLTQYQEDRISGSGFEFASGPLPSIDPGDAATVNNNANVPLSDDGKQVFSDSEFSLDNNDGVDLPPGVYYFDEFKALSTIRLTGKVVIYVTGSAILDDLVSSSDDPLDFQLYIMGPSCTLKSNAAIYGVIYAPSASIEIKTGVAVHGMAVGGELSLNNDSEAAS